MRFGSLPLRGRWWFCRNDESVLRMVNSYNLNHVMLNLFLHDSMQSLVILNQVQDDEGWSGWRELV